MGDKRDSGQRGGRAYFPRNAPTEWSYTTAFVAHSNRGFITVGNRAKAKLDGVRVSEHKDAWSNPRIIEQLEAIRNAAQKEELAFISKYKIDIGDGSWGALIKAFSLIFMSEEAFKRNLQLLNQVKDGDSAIYHYFSSLLSSYIQKAARDVIGKKLSQLVKIDLKIVMNDLVDEILELGLRRMFSMVDKKTSSGYIETHYQKQKNIQGTEIQVYKDLLRMIKEFMSTPFKKMVQEELGLTEDFIRETIRIKQLNKRAPGQKGTGGSRRLPVLTSTVVNGNAKGSVQELFEKVFVSQGLSKLDGLTFGNGFLTFRTGFKGVKSDVIGSNLATAKGYVDISPLLSTSGKDKSNRVNQIKNSEKFFQHLRKAKGEIVFISDKNYQIKTTGFKGYMAQGNIKLTNLEALLNKVGYSGDFSSLLDYLANCGQNMLFGSGNTAEILSGVATQIGHFLFDDLTITATPAGVNRVHLLNLSGFYMPLSVYMDALIHAVRSAEKETYKYVNTKFVGKGGLPSKGGWPNGTGDFESFRERRISESYLEVHFMKDIANFITSHVKI